YEDAAEGPRLVNETIDIGAFENIYVVPDGNKIVYVDKKVRPGGKCNGESWEHAIPELSDALLGIMGIRKVNDNTDIDSIWVAESVYYPKYESDAMKLIGKDSRNNSFILFDSISIYGGFAPNRDDYTNPVANEISDAAPDLNKTILSGNIGDASDSTDNTVHVVIASNITKTLLNGFYIEDGYAANATALTVNGNTIDPEFGGGIYCDDVINFSAERLRFNNNHAKNSGGGLYIANGNINLDSSRFNNNGVANNGGGLYISNGLGNLANSCFNGNSAKNAGGAVYSNDMLYSQNSSYAGNMAVANGGAVNAGNGFSSIKDSFVENTANIGGGLYIANDIGSLDSSCFNNNSAENEGGAVYSSNKLYSRNSNYIGNTAVAAGGAVNAGNGFSSVQDSFVENTANIGGGLYIANDIAAFDSSYFNRNSADDAGGAVYSEKKLYSVKSIYSGNTAVTAGGAVNAGNGFSSTRDTFTGNTAGNGGACYVVLDTTKIFNSVFSHNTANKATSQGAALYVNNSKYWSIYRSEFLQNVSLGKGGAVYAENSRKGKFVNSRVAGNQANIDGGGIYISNADTNIFANTLISGNMAPAGGGMYVADGVNFYTNLTIGGNSLGLVPAVGFENSSGIYVEDGEHYFRNSVVWANDDTNRVQVAASGTTIKYYYSLLQNQDLSLSGNGNLNGTLPGNNPQFVDIGPVKTVFEGGNYRVYPTSNLINKGSNSYFDMGAIPDLSKDTFDLGGESRILQGNIDIGAYEFDGTYRLTISDKTITANEQQQHIDSVYLTINGIDLLDTRPFITYSYYLTGDDTTLLPELPVCPDTYMVVAVYSGGIYPDCTDTATLIIKQDPSPKSITFDPLPTKYLNYDPDFQLTATSSTEDIVKFTITGGDTACISLTDDGWVTMLDTGVVYISAYQVYNCSYLMPDTVERELIITKFHQEIIFVDAIEDHVLFVNGVNMNPPIRNLTAYADTSKLPITYRIVDGDPSIIDLTPNGRVTLFDTGTVFIRAEQAGNDIYYAAEPVICRLHISAVNASFDSITNVTGKVSFNPTDTVIYYTIPCDYTDNIMEFNFYTSSNAEIRSRDGEDYYPLVTDVSAPGQQSFYFELYVVPTDGTEPISVPYTFIIRKNYMFDDLVITKWDNTFIVNNKRAEEEFGLEPVGRNDQGGALYNYKWYIDGEVIEKYMDKSYYSAGDTKNDKLSTTSEYYLVLGTGDGREITTCPYRHPGTSSWEAFASSYPNPVSAGSTITVESNLYEAGSGSTYIDVYSIKGAKILTKDVTSEKTSIRMPSQKGLYVIVVRNSKNKKQISVVVQ
ncbi:MAG: T9SS type A sorting domain-containing protein, partial [Bacteroidales bacterium]|nr:T9SS type A sorting domain-containing protein [Bacteroidales bacterium]